MVLSNACPLYCFSTDESQTASTGAAWGNYASRMTSDGQTSTGQTGSVAEMLAAASDRVVERCGYSYNESVGMYYDNRLGLYYDQVRKREVERWSGGRGENE